MPEIVISEFMDQDAVNCLARQFEVYYDKNLVNEPEKLAELARDCTALIVRNRTQVRGPLLDGHKLRVIGRLGVGLDNIDCAECAKKDIEVIPATGANDVSVAEYVIAGILMLLRGSYADTAEVAAGKWPREKLIGHEVLGKTLGLVGFGGIAREVAARAKALSMNVIAYDPFVAANDKAWSRLGVKQVDLDYLLANSNALSLHVPLNDSTRSLLDAKRIAAMKKGAVIINTSRGGVADEKAVAEALKSGQLGGALFDVFAKEPLPAGSALADAPNCILTPHIAGVTDESNIRVSALIADKVADALNKEQK